jgi:arabinofuranan 3-O-arabinosyltransferase
MIEFQRTSENASVAPSFSQVGLQWLDILLTRRRILHYPTILLVASYLGFVVAVFAGDFPFDAFGRPLAVDFIPKLTAGRIAIDGDIQQLYQSEVQWEVQQQILGHRDPTFLNLFISPSVGAWLYAPLAVLPYFPASLIWTVASVGLFIAAFHVFWPLLPRLHEFGHRRVKLVAFSAPPVIECIQTGQDSVVSLVLLVAAVKLLLGGRYAAAGAVIGLGMFKPQLFVFLPIVLIAQRQWKALLAFVATASVLAGASVLPMGFDGIGEYAALLTSDEYTLGIAEAQSWHMMSLSAVFRSFVPVDARHLADGLLLICGAAGTYAMTRRALRSSMSNRRRDARLLASTVLITGLSIPHFFSYDCTILLVPALILLNERISDRRVHLAILSLYFTLFAALPLHVLASRGPSLVRIIDTQWAVIPMLALLWLAWRPRAVDAHIRPLGHRSVPGSRSLGRAARLGSSAQP